MRPSTVTTPRPVGLGLLEGGDDPLGLVDLGVGGREHPVARLDLAGVDERLAVEAHLPALHALGLEPLGVLDVVVDPVEDDLAGGPGRQQRQRQAAQQRRPAGHVLGPQLLGQVVGAHDQHGQPLGRQRHLLGVQHGDGRLDHGPQGRVVGGAALLQALHDGVDGLGRVDLGHDHGRGAGRGHGPQVVGVPGRADAVDADGHLALAVAAGGGGLAHPVAGLGLGVGGHGVLEVEDEGVGRQRGGLLQRPLVGAGHVQHAAAGPERGVDRRHVTHRVQPSPSMPVTASPSPA